MMDQKEEKINPFCINRNDIKLMRPSSCSIILRETKNIIIKIRHNKS